MSQQPKRNRRISPKGRTVLPWDLARITFVLTGILSLSAGLWLIGQPGEVGAPAAFLQMDMLSQSHGMSVH